MSATKIQVTKNYGLFKRHGEENRPLDIKKHKKLSESMKKYGFLPTFPIVVVRNDKGTLIIKDGQHRHWIAELLGLPVYWVESKTDFDVAIVNSAAKGWQLRDYAQKWASQGKQAYVDGLDFTDGTRIPIGQAFALLAGTTSFGNCQGQFITGTFKIKDRAWADAVAGIYVPLKTMNSAINNARFIEACMAVCRVKEFDAKRLLANADRCREKLVPYATRDAYLVMLESVYNFGRKQLFGLKIAAEMAMRERNATARNPKNAKPKSEEVA